MGARLKRKSFHVFCVLVNLVFAFSALFPILWLFLASFKTNREIYQIPVKILPARWITDNYTDLFSQTDYDILQSLFITFLVAVTACVLTLAINMMAAYVFARLEFRGKRFFWWYCVITMYIPGLTILITSFLVVNRIGLTDTFLGLVLPGVTSGYSIFFFRQFFLGMPVSIEEAALIDGSSRFQIFWKIFIPMSTSPMVIIGTGAFVGYWNSFIWPAIIISRPELTQIMVVIRMMNAAYTNQVGVVMAATSIAIVPPIVLFAFFQKYIVKGIILSGLK